MKRWWNAREPRQRTWVGRRERWEAPVEDGGHVAGRAEVSSGGGCLQVQEGVLLAFSRQGSRCARRVGQAGSSVSPGRNWSTRSSSATVWGPRSCGADAGLLAKNSGCGRGRGEAEHLAAVLGPGQGLLAKNSGWPLLVLLSEHSQGPRGGSPKAFQIRLPADRGTSTATAALGEAVDPRHVGVPQADRSAAHESVLQPAADPDPWPNLNQPRYWRHRRDRQRRVDTENQP
jgi:hypothetical protein